MKSEVQATAMPFIYKLKKNEIAILKNKNGRTAIALTIGIFHVFFNKSQFFIVKMKCKSFLGHTILNFSPFSVGVPKLFTKFLL